MNFCKKILLLSPIIILIPMLYFINYTVDFFQDVTYTFVLNTNIGSVQMLEQELEEHKEIDPNYSEIRESIIHIFNMTMGKKRPVVTFLMDENGKVYHSNHENEIYVEELLENKEELQAKTSQEESGHLILQNLGKEQHWYYHTFAEQEQHYLFFMSVDKEMLESSLEINNIVIPICIICIILILSIEYSFWLTISRKRKKRGEGNGN